MTAYDEAVAALDWARANGCEVDFFAAREDARREAEYVVGWLAEAGQPAPDIEALAEVLAEEVAL